MTDRTNIIGVIEHHSSDLIQDIHEIRGVVEQLNEFHTFHISPPVLITIPDGKTPRQRRREEERRNKRKLKKKPLYNKNQRFK